MSAFDSIVRSLRGQVTPKSSSKSKAECTPEEWAAKLDYLLLKQRHYLATDAVRLASLRESTRLWRLRSKHKLDAYEKSDRGREVRRRAKRKWGQKQRASNPVFRAIMSLRRRTRRLVRHAASGSGAIRRKFFDELGCTPQHLREHLESQFTCGMHWDNYGVGKGKWHVDHIVSLASFDLSSEQQRRVACNWRNLRPMWSDDNIAKGASSDFAVALKLFHPNEE